MNESPPVLIGERVLWLGSGSGLPKGAKVKWIGRLPEMGPDWAVGIELDEALPYGGIDGTWGNRKLFDCEHKHGLIVPSNNVITQPLQKFATSENGASVTALERPAKRESKSDQSTQTLPKTEKEYPGDSRSLVHKHTSCGDDKVLQVKCLDPQYRKRQQITELDRRHLKELALLQLASNHRSTEHCEQLSLESITFQEERLCSLLLERYRIQNVLERARRMNYKTDVGWRGENSEGRSSTGGTRRDRSSGIFSIFRWFKRDRSSSIDSEDNYSPQNSPELLRRQPGSICGSVDTLFSTATANSFAFVPPSYYRPFGSAAEPEIRIALGPETGSYRNRIRQRDRLRQLERNITLKEKYRLYGSGTLPRSADRINEFPADLRESIFRSIESPGSRNSTFGRKKRRAPQPPSRENSTSDKSLPATLALDAGRTEDEFKQHRRALSEPVKYVKISCHVKGKRKAPPPPTARVDSEDIKNKTESVSGERTLSWKRKKRPAPPPPVKKEDTSKEPIIDIVREAAHEIINQEYTANGSVERLEDTKAETASNASTVDIGSSDIVSTDTLRLERGILKPNRMEVAIVEPKYSPSSPVSPRPWYKRQTTPKDQHHSSKSNERKKDKKKVEEWMLESGFPRRVMTSSNTDSKFNIFSKMDKSEDKRRSQISILTNISELDREAAEIIQKGKEMEKALIASQDAMFYTKTEGEEKDNSLNLEATVETADSPKRTSTRELISLFNAITNVTKVTVNTSFFSRDGLFKRESNEKRSSLFMDRTTIGEEKNYELRPRISNGDENIQMRNFNDILSEGAKISSLANIYRTPDVVITDSSACSSSSGASEGRITKVTIEELDEYDAERNSKAQAMYEAHRLARHQSPPIPTITEVSESSFKSSPASTLKSTTSDSTSSEPPSPVQPSASSSVLKSLVWVCPRCTLENLRWRITCEACDMWRPIPCEFKEQTQKPKSSVLPLLKIVEKKEVENDTIRLTNESSERKESVNKMNPSVKSDELIIKEIITSRESLIDPPKKPLEPEKRTREKQICDEELSQSIPLTSKTETDEKTEVITRIQSQPLPAPPSDGEMKKESKNDDTDDSQTEEIRRARLAFFNKNKQKPSKEGTLTKECQTISEKLDASTTEKEDDKKKLREMLKEMKHSLPKRPKPDNVLKPNADEEKKNHDRQQIAQERLGAISKIPNLPVKKKKQEINIKESDTQEDVIKCDDNEKAEAYLVESETIVEEIHYKKPPEKVSSSVQTSSQVRAIPMVEKKPPPVKEVIVPITVEEYRIKDGVLYTSITKKAKRIGTGTFHLMRPRDFANIEAIKTAGKSAAHIYANVSSSDPSPSTSSDGPEPPLPSKRSPILPKKSSDLSLEKLSLQLTKPLGVASFRAGLAPGKENNNMNTLAVNRLLRRLEAAIVSGQHELAAALARELAQMQISCSVTRHKLDTPAAMIPVDLFVEDKTSHQGPIALRVRPSMTVLQLKHKMEREYEIPLKVQRWILGRKLANDDKATLESMGVDTPGTPIFLYLVAPGTDGTESAGISNKTIEVEETPTVIKIATPEGMEDLEEEPLTPEIKEEPVNPNGTLALGWKCETCTLVNSPTRPGCAACASVRPTNYAIPHEYVASEAEARRLDLEKQMELEAIKEAEREEKQLNYQRMLDMVEKDDLILYTEEFECPVCLMECEPMNGVVLRECLHVFCRPCLAQTVEFSEEAEVKCPFRDNNYTCDSTLLEREIKALVTAEVYEQHLAKSIALAETKIGNAFHCKTPDCKGWCIYEDNVNTFRCPVCTHDNCLTCQAVHEGLDCKQFQEQLNNDSDTNAESRRTKEMLQEMVDRGEAMNCPTCQVVLMKKWGCDWLKCSMCKTEICWITRGPRWGPNGKGDISGGCQCGVNGVKCHPKCTYCH